MDKIPLGQYSYLFEGEERLDELFTLHPRILKKLQDAYIELEVAAERGGPAPSQDIINCLRSMRKVIKNKR
jgi:hypothetical protein